jgi:hypothetical protein
MDQKLKTITITPEKIAKWESEAEELRKRISEDTHHLQIITQRLEALSLFVDDAGRPGQEAPVKTEANKDALLMSPPQFILPLLQTNPEPMTIAKLRQRVESAGYAKEKFGPGFRYLYNIISRLLRTGKVHKDGKRYMVKRTATLSGVS